MTTAQTHEQGLDQLRIPIRHDRRRRTRHINVGGTERRWSTYGGAALVVLGLARKSIGGLALAGVGGGLLYRGMTGHCPLYGSLDINTVDEQDDAAEPGDYFSSGIHVEYAITIAKSPEELYQFWHNFENLPRFMQHLESVQVLDEKKSRWAAKGPAGSTVQWDAEIINDEPNETIAWRSLGGSDVDNAGSVRFVRAPGDRGTEVRVVLDYIPPAGRVGSTIAWLLGQEPEIQVKADLRRFKQLMETGEIPTTDGQPRGSCGG